MLGLARDYLKRLRGDGRLFCNFRTCLEAWVAQ